MITQQTRKIPNWKCPGLDGVQGYWLKNLPVLHERIATQIGHLKVDDNRENDTLLKRSRQRKCSG